MKLDVLVTINPKPGATYCGACHGLDLSGEKPKCWIFPGKLHEVARATKGHVVRSRRCMNAESKLRAARQSAWERGLAFGKMVAAK